MQVGGCHICGGTHELGLCMVQDDASNEVNYIGSHNHHGFHQRGPLGFYQSDNFLQDHVGDIIQVITSSKGVHLINIIARDRVIKRNPLT